MKRLIAALSAAAFVLAAVSVPADATAQAAATTAPTLQAISPLAGAARGGDTLAISGQNLGHATAVVFGSTRTTKVTHVSSTRLEVVVPAHVKGAVRVRVLVGSDPISGVAHYRFTAPPAELHWSKDRRIDPERGSLDEVSCPTTDFCVAVDDSFNNVRLIAFGAGRKTTITAVPARIYTPLVSCGSPTFCLAVSGANVSSWNGTRWTSFRTAIGKKIYLGPISCVASTRFCVTTGGSGGGYAYRDGKWSAVAAPKGVSLGAISCATTTFCMSVANGAGYRFNGTKWTKSSGRVSGQKYDESRVSCTSKSFCLAVNDDGTSTEFDGYVWDSVGDEFYPGFTAVSCASVSLCLAVNRAGEVATFTDAGWTTAAPIADAGGVGAVSCVPGGTCTAVDGLGAAFRLNGTTWSAPRRISASSGDLTDVSCPTATWCMAIDAHGNAVRESGGKWTSPRGVDPYHDLVAVSCPTTRFCVAIDNDVSGSTSSSSTHPSGRVIVYRSGQWAAPKLVEHGSNVTDVSCASAAKCVAVDDAGAASTWNGHSWSKPRIVGRGLGAVDCPSVRVCVAVGRTSAIQRSGHWQRLANPARTRRFYDLTCLRPGYCVAVGSHGFYVWNQGVWSTPIQSGFTDTGTVACVSERFCIGSEDNGADIWDYKFDGSSSTFLGTELYGPTMSCLAKPICTAVELDTVTVGR